MKDLAKAADSALDLAAAFDASPNPYVVITPEFRIVGMNAAYLAVTGRIREDIVGRDMFEAFDAGPGEEAQNNMRQLRQSLERVRDTGERDHIPLIRYAIPQTASDGTTTHTDRYWSATHAPLFGPDGRLAYILQHTSDVTELQRLRSANPTEPGAHFDMAMDNTLGGAILGRAEQVQQDNRRLEDELNSLVEQFMQAPGFIAVLSGPTHIIQRHNEAYGRLIGREGVLGKTVEEAMPDIADQGFFELMDEVFATGQPYTGRAVPVTFQPTPDAPPQKTFVDFIYQPVRKADGRIVGIFVQGYDVGDSVRAAERQKLMIDELNHRVKNTLATVQSIAMQTARSNTDPATFAASFQARLLALSHTHDLLTRSHWEGAGLRNILEHETEAHGASRITLTGPAVALGPAAALSFGMIFHELATNAAKYGALSAPGGRVMIDWHVAGEEERQLYLVWRELDGPAITPPAHRGFGSRLIERNVRHDLAGTVKVDYGSAGLVAEFAVPLDRSSVA